MLQNIFGHVKLTLTDHAKLDHAKLCSCFHVSASEMTKWLAFRFPQDMKVMIANSHGAETYPPAAQKENSQIVPATEKG